MNLLSAKYVIKTVLRMIQLWVLFAVQCALTGGLTYSEVTHNCWPEDGYCITLFVNDIGISWAQAKDHCEENGDGLLEIKSPSVQQHVASLTAELGDTRNAWIGGIRRNEYRLRNVDGHHALEFQAILRIGDDNSNCVMAFMEIEQIQYAIDNCDERHGRHSVICKKENFRKAHPGIICLNDIAPNDTCYVVMYNGSDLRDHTGPDWFSAQNMCRWDLPGFDLFDDTDVDVMTSVLSHIGGSIWTGYFRKPWVWSDHENIAYFNWAPGYVDSSTIECMTIDKDGMWRHTGCHELRQHHMCTKTIPTSPPPIVTTTTATTVTTSDAPKTVDDQSSISPDHYSTSSSDTSEDNTGANPTGTRITLGNDTDNAQDVSVPLYAGAAVGAVAFVVFVILVSVFVTRMQKRKSNDARDGQGNAYVNTSTDVTQEPNDLATNQDPQYSSLGNQPDEFVANQDSQYSLLGNQPDEFVTNQDSQYSSLGNHLDYEDVGQEMAYERICGSFDPTLSQNVPDCGTPYAEVTIRT